MSDWQNKKKIWIQLGDTNSVNAEIFNRKILFLDISLLGLHAANWVTKCDKAVNLNSTWWYKFGELKELCYVYNFLHKILTCMFNYIRFVFDISLLGLHAANFWYSSQTCVGENYYLFCWLGLHAAKWQDLITMNTVITLFRQIML